MLIKLYKNCNHTHYSFIFECKLKSSIYFKMYIISESKIYKVKILYQTNITNLYVNMIDTHKALFFKFKFLLI